MAIKIRINNHDVACGEIDFLLQEPSIGLKKYEISFTYDITENRFDRYCDIEEFDRKVSESIVWDIRAIFSKVQIDRSMPLQYFIINVNRVSKVDGPSSLIFIEGEAIESKVGKGDKSGKRG